mmetsp:Transcript_131265/g.339958  ORF Transcript_131265/g.339958 Transcript_131265/m.339958 type:complete len:220 (+) Transcript_131265:1146-1805(+)
MSPQAFFVWLAATNAVPVVLLPDAATEPESASTEGKEAVGWGACARSLASTWTSSALLAGMAAVTTAAVTALPPTKRWSCACKSSRARDNLSTSRRWGSSATFSASPTNFPRGGAASSCPSSLHVPAASASSWVWPTVATGAAYKPSMWPRQESLSSPSSQEKLEMPSTSHATPNCCCGNCKRGGCCCCCSCCCFCSCCCSCCCFSCCCCCCCCCCNSP